MASFVSTITAAWAEIVAPLVEQGFRSSTRLQVEPGKAVVELEGPGSVALIEVWEHAQCLDTTVLHLPSRKSSILAAGPCQSHTEALGRLTALRATLLSHAGK